MQEGEGEGATGRSPWLLGSARLLFSQAHSRSTAFTSRRVFLADAPAPLAETPRNPPNAKATPPRAEGWGRAGGCRRGLGCVRGLPRPGQGGDRVPVPLDGRRPRSRSRSRSRRIPAPARGLPATRHPRCALRAAPGTGFPCRHPLENRGAPEPEPKGLSQRGATAGTVLGGSETKSSLSLPSRPRFWFPSVFLSFFYFPLSLSKGLPAFP